MDKDVITEVADTIDAPASLAEHWIHFAVALLVAVVVARIMVVARNRFEEDVRARYAFRILFIYLPPVAAYWINSAIDKKHIDDYGVLLAEDVVPLAATVALTVVWITAQSVEVAATESLKKIRDNLEFLLEMTLVFLGVVGEKAARVNAATQEAQPNDDSARLQLIRTALDPEEQIDLTIQALRRFFSSLREEKDAKVRVVYFKNDGTYLVPEISYIETGYGGRSVTTRTRRPEFKINAANREKYAVVAAAYSDENIVIGDTAEAHEDPEMPFTLIEASGSEKMKSLIAMPMHRGEQWTRPCESVIVIYTDKAGFFAEQSPEEMERLRVNLAQRLLFEGDLKELLGV